MDYMKFKAAGEIADNLAFRLYEAYSYAKCAKRPPTDFSRADAINHLNETITNIKYQIEILNAALEKLPIDKILKI